MIITRVNSNLIKQSTKLGLSVLITCAVAQHFDRISFVFYPLLAVILIVDDQDENTFQAARGRILGTVIGPADLSRRRQLIHSKKGDPFEVTDDC